MRYHRSVLPALLPEYLEVLAHRSLRNFAWCGGAGVRQGLRGGRCFGRGSLRGGVPGLLRAGCRPPCFAVCPASRLLGDACGLPSRSHRVRRFGPRDLRVEVCDRVPRGVARNVLSHLIEVEDVGSFTRVTAQLNSDVRGGDLDDLALPKGPSQRGRALISTERSGSVDLSFLAGSNTRSLTRKRGAEPGWCF